MTTVYLLLDIKLKHQEEVLQQIKEILENEPAYVKYELRETFADWDFFLKISAENLEQVKTTILKIKNMKKISRHLTLLQIAGGRNLIRE